GQANAVFKNITLDMINYGRLKMFLHAQGGNVNDDEVSAFIRLGTDFTENYYEIEVPLKITAQGKTDPRDIWPIENEIDIPLDALYAAKAARNRASNDPTNNTEPGAPYTYKEGERTYYIRVKGRPELSTVQTVMLGVRNGHEMAGVARSFCVWANELRVADFDQTNGWAANARLNAKLADFANITASMRYTSFGFGGIQRKLAQPTREEITEFDIAANITVDKFFPEKFGLKIPMYVSYRTTLITPEFDPREPDIPLEASLSSYDSDEARQEDEEPVQDNTV